MNASESDLSVAPLIACSICTILHEPLPQSYQIEHDDGCPATSLVITEAQRG